MDMTRPPAHLSATALAMIASPDIFTNPRRTQVTRSVYDGVPIFFTVADRKDRIQARHVKGRFYEPEELKLIAQYFPRGGVFCDAGANIGNHSIYALKLLGASVSIPFEPNPAAYELFLSNMILNGVLDRVNLSTLGYGLSDRSDAPSMSLEAREKNLGATRLVASDEGQISMASGDALLDGARIDFLKVDVEGMELEVLRGFEQSIAASRPPIFLEVDHKNSDALMAWAAGQGYGVLVEGRSFKMNRNVLLGPLA
ncbi:FkbM family methyltransferase [Cypionkella psychrotolerans]|uniref:FkbM family methyltransferase n=1 Tax=Cypionkella psychrotolerans TaxID=1678131 RepID=UPI0006B64B2F|nr:FkbM family methyltransferase [Cypionkella psychrotolerans]